MDPIYSSEPDVRGRAESRILSELLRSQRSMRPQDSWKPQQHEAVGGGNATESSYLV